ncbi:hypothetical protein D3C85_1451340 [compost metagenome]
MNEIPPLRANAIAIPSSDTACMTAEENGIFSEIAGSSPLLNLTSGVFSFTFAGVHAFVVRLGINKNSLNVRDGSI